MAMLRLLASTAGKRPTTWSNHPSRLITTTTGRFSLTMTGSKKDNGSSSSSSSTSTPSFPSLGRSTALNTPRRLRVRRNPSSSDCKPSSKSLIDRVGRIVRKKKPPLNEEIKDAAGQSILIPGTISSFTAKRNTSTRLRLPLVNASALLDTQHYCVRTASASTSRSGTEAARRLLRGKRELVHVLRDQLSVDHPSSFVLQGHGVPPQLLQYHVDLADYLLRRCAADECSFSSKHLVESTDQQPQSIGWIRVRKGSGNEGRPWPLNDPSEWHTAMQLYLTVMKRLASTLSVVLPPSRQANDIKSTTTVDDYDNVFTSSSASKSSLHHWNVEMTRGMAFPPDWFHHGPGGVPSDQLQSTVSPPIIEWTPLQGRFAPGNVSIRLQGYPTLGDASAKFPASATGRRLRRRQAVSLCFDAGFRSTTTTTTSDPDEYPSMP